MPMTSVNIRQDLWRRIKIIAMDRRVSMASVINEAIEVYLKKPQSKRVTKDK